MGKKGSRRGGEDWGEALSAKFDMNTTAQNCAAFIFYSQADRPQKNKRLGRDNKSDFNFGTDYLKKK